MKAMGLGGGGSARGGGGGVGQQSPPVGPVSFVTLTRYDERYLPTTKVHR